MTNVTMSDHAVAAAIAPTWERRRGSIEEVCTPVREWLVRELAPRPGDTVLELAAGAGDTGFDAAELVGEWGRLISSDFSPAMLEVAQRRGEQRGVENAEYLVLDAEHIELDDDAVDGMLCRFAYMLLAHPAVALTHARRVLRPGVRLALAVWAAPERNPFFTLVATRLVQGGHMAPPPPPPAPGIFAMGSHEHTRDLLRAAGFPEVRTEEVEVRFPVPSIAEYVAFTADTAGPMALVLQGLSADDRAALEADLEASLRPFRRGDGYELPGSALCAVAA